MDSNAPTLHYVCDVKEINELTSTSGFTLEMKLVSSSFDIVAVFVGKYKQKSPIYCNVLLSCGRF